MDQPVVFECHHQKRQHGFQPAETVDYHRTRLARVLPGRVTRNARGRDRHHRGVERAVQGSARIHDPPLVQSEAYQVRR